jgi:hypothetical protein
MKTDDYLLAAILAQSNLEAKHRRAFQP